MEQGHDGHDPFSMPGLPPVRVVASRDGPRLELQVHGEADVETSARLRRDMVAELDEGVREVVVDVSTLSFCDLAGSDVLHDFIGAATVRAITADVRGMSPLLAMIFRDFPPRRPTQAVRRRKRLERTEPADLGSVRRDSALEPSGGQPGP